MSVFCYAIPEHLAVTAKDFQNLANPSSLQLKFPD